MIRKHRLKNVVIFIQTILNFVVSRKIINVYNYIPRKYRNVRVEDFWNYEKLVHKKNKLDIEFFNKWKQFSVHPKFLIFKL